MGWERGGVGVGVGRADRQIREIYGQTDRHYTRCTRTEVSKTSSLRCALDHAATA